MQDNGMNHKNWDRAEREHLERRAGLDQEDDEDVCPECGGYSENGNDKCDDCEENEEEE